MPKIHVVTILLALLFATGASGQTVTAFKAGEQVTGMTKQCFYTFGGSEYVQTLSSTALCPLSIQVPSVPRSSTEGTAMPSGLPTVTAFKVGERTTGMTKQCFYRFGASDYVRTIQAIDLCPLSIPVKP